MAKILFVLAGGNGAGKTSFYLANKNIFEDLPFVNADLLLKDMVGNNDVENAPLGQELALKEIEKLLESEKSFCFETVFSHESKVELITKAKNLGYSVALFFLNLGDESLNIARVGQRVLSGGHDVPVEKIISRIPRTNENVKRALMIVDSFFLIDNSSLKGHEIVASKNPGEEITVIDGAPQWVSSILSHMPKTVIAKSKAKALKTAPQKKYVKCVRCDRRLRGKKRLFYGVCSICEPIMQGTG